MRSLFRWIMELLKIKHEHGPKEGEGKSFVSIPSRATLGHISFQIHGISNFNDKEQKKFMAAIELGTKVLNSLEFRNMVSQYQYAENRGLTGLQVWEVICTGKDLYNPKDDNDIDVFVTMYHNFWTGTIGYTFPNTFKTWMNRKFFDGFRLEQIFGNVMHEAMHNFGFSHKDATTQHDSVPYKVGYFARDLAERIVEGQELTPIKVV